jgi:hypothetical protein
MRDFTSKVYKKLLNEMLKSKYRFMTFEEYIHDKEKKEKVIILRHDVDKHPLRSLRTAEMENELGIKGTYYFRVVRNKLPREVLERIVKLGHEIGYHYDDLNAADGVIENALDLFQKNLARLRELASVKTACMHGSPMSSYDNRELWESHSYREFGIIGEPYFDIDFNEVMYLTDTGRRWDGERVSIRDKVVSSEKLVVSSQDEENRRQKEEECRGAVSDPPALQHESGVSSEELKVSSRKNKAINRPMLPSTMDIIKALKNDQLPNKIMLTIHPQRWTDNYFFWLYELIWQKIKNPIKYLKLKRLEKINKK